MHCPLSCLKAQFNIGPVVLELNSLTNILSTYYCAIIMVVYYYMYIPYRNVPWLYLGLLCFYLGLPWFTMVFTIDNPWFSLIYQHSFHQMLAEH